MPKHGFMTAKAVSNRQKSKGLQKLRWFCQMCQKQCRDDNGFKCHLMSESHQRQLLIVAENPNMFLDEFSGEFQREYLKVLRTQFGSRRVHVNQVYQTYIAYKEHTHLNATHWTSLTEFAEHLGKEGIVKLDETDKGIFITYIDKNPEAEARRRRLEKLERNQKDDDERQAAIIQAQIEKDRARAEPEEPESREMIRDNDEEKVVLKLDSKRSLVKPAVVKGDFKESLRRMAMAEGNLAKKERPGKRKLTELERIKIMNEERKRARQDRSDAEESARQALAVAQQEAAMAVSRPDKHHKPNWLYEGIVVKVMNKALSDGKFYKQKGYVKKLVEKDVAKVRILDSKAVLRLHQDFLETVIPALHAPVLVVNGRYRGHEAELTALDYDHFCASVKMKEGPFKGETIPGVPYEDICKLA